MFKQTIFHGAKLLFSSECRLFFFSIARHLSTLFPRPPHRKIHLLTTVDENLSTFSGNTCTFHKNLPPFSPRHSTAIFPSASLTRVHAHALSEFSFSAFTAQRLTHNPLKTRGLWVKPSPFVLHDKSNITNCATIFCGEGRGEGKNEKKGEGKQGEAFTRIVLFDNQLWINGEEVKAKIKKRRMRAYARVCVVKDILFLHRRRLGMLGKGA